MTDTAPPLEALIAGGTATVAVVGLGYVGLPLCGAFVEAGYTVLGVDVDPAKVEALDAGRSYIQHLGEGFVPGMNATGRFTPTADLTRLAEADAILLCVPTPLGEHLEPDLRYVQATAEAVAAAARPDQLVVLESTTYPGTTREVILPLLEARGLPCGQPGGCYVAYSPEREDPGREGQSTRTIPKLVGGIDRESGRLAGLLYGRVIREVHVVESAEVAEAAKLLENIFRSVNIALVNEMKVVLQRMGIDVFKVVDAAATKPFGFMPFYPGPGLGGHCIPIDPYYLTWKAREVGLSTRFIELAGEVNRRMPEYVVERTMLALNDVGKAVSRSRVLVLGLAYKPDVDDVRESPSFELITRFRGLGAEVSYADPHVPATWKTRDYDLQMTAVEVTPEALQSFDVVVVATHHRAFDWEMIGEHASLVVDTRGALRAVAAPAADVRRA